MSIAPNLPTNIIKDTDIQFSPAFIKTLQIPSMCIDNNSNFLSSNNCNFFNPRVSIFESKLNPSQQFIYNPVKKRLINNNNNCLDNDDYGRLIWSPCDQSNQNQQYEFISNSFKNINNKCVDLNYNRLYDCNNTSNTFNLLNNIVNDVNNQHNYIRDNITNMLNTLDVYIDKYNQKKTDTDIISQNLGRKLNNMISKALWNYNNWNYYDNGPRPDSIDDMYRQVYASSEYINTKDTLNTANSNIDYYIKVIALITTTKDNLNKYNSDLSQLQGNLDATIGADRLNNKTFDDAYNNAKNIGDKSRLLYNNIINEYKNIISIY
jgi:hypothetical protein